MRTQRIGAMLAEIVGKRTADSYLTATGTAKKDTIRNVLTGNGRSKVTDWPVTLHGVSTARPQKLLTQGGPTLVA